VLDARLCFMLATKSCLWYIVAQVKQDVLTRVERVKGVRERIIFVMYGGEK
jgi:hypothetical protein